MGTPVFVEPPLKYGPSSVWFLTRKMRGHRLAGSLTGFLLYADTFQV